MPTSRLPERLEFAPGTDFAGRYTIIEQAGEGGMGVVFKAIDRVVRQEVALKLIQPRLARDPSYLERFRREVRLTRLITHPNVCRVHDLGESGGVLFISMEWIRGETLRKLLNQVGKLPEDRALEISQKICLALQAAHDKGIVHRDLKPENVMIDDRGEIFVMDFGLAAERRKGDRSSSDGMMGTPFYMAPEQLRGGPVDARADLFALGLVLREMLTGEHAAHTGRSQRPWGVRREIQAVLESLLSEDREHRYDSAKSVGVLLQELRGKGKTQGRRLVWLSAVAAALLVVLAVAVGPWNRRHPEPVPAQVYYDRGMHYLIEEAETVRSVDNAIQMFHRALQADSTLGLTWAGLGEAYWARFERMHEPFAREEAERAVKRALALDGSLPQTRNAEARGFIVQGRYKEARELLEKIVQEKPDFDMAWANLGRACQGLGDYAGGLEAIQRAIRIRPDRFRHQVSLGNFYQRFKEHEAAEKAYRKAIELKPDSPLAWHNLGACYLQRNDPQRASQALLRALEYDERAATVSNLGTAFYEMKNYEEAVARYRRATELEPHSATHYGNLGDALRMLGRSSQAHDAYTQAMRLAGESVLQMPHDASAHISLALWCARAGDLDRAFAEGAHAAEMQPESGDILFTNAVIRCILGRDEDALDWLGKAARFGVGRAEIESDPDLSRLRQNPRYRRILELAS